MIQRCDSVSVTSRHVLERVSDTLRIKYFVVIGRSVLILYHDTTLRFERDTPRLFRVSLRPMIKGDTIGSYQVWTCIHWIRDQYLPSLTTNLREY